MRIVRWTVGLAVVLLPAMLAGQMMVEITEAVETGFGAYTPYPVSVTPSVAPYTIQPDLSNVTNLNGFGFSEHAEEMLAQNGFVVTPSTYKQMYDIYNFCHEENIPVFVTTDAVLHAYHILFDYGLRVLEMQMFYDDLVALTSGMVDEVYEQVQAAPEGRVKQAAVRNWAYFWVAGQLLGDGGAVPAEISERVQEELDLIDGHAGFEASPIFGYQEDYSQYVPRGHYTRNSTLEAYFRAMMWYGRMMFRVDPDTNDTANVAGKMETTQALLIVKALSKLQVGAEPATDVWDRIYEPTVFFVGRTDDLNVYDYLDTGKTVWGEDFPDVFLTELADTTKLEAFIDSAKTLRNPMINSSWVGDWEDFQIKTKGFRFMGQRFIPDAYMFQQLVHRLVYGRFMPRGLDVMAVLGSSRAYAILGDLYGETLNPDYEPQMTKLRDEFGSLESAAWAQNLYWNWLYTLMPLLFDKGEGYPLFMQNQAWTDKELNTALGSWAELRHDTILYAKQSYSEFTGVPTPPDRTRGYVEPNPHLYARLAALAGWMNAGLSERNLLPEEFEGKLDTLETLLLDLKAISEKELTNQALSDAETETIWRFGETLESLLTFSPEVSGQVENDTDDNMAVVADVHTDPNTETCLEEGVGYPFQIFVVCPVEGSLIITQGAVFSYYEFAQPMADRMTDEAWQEKQAGSDPTLPPAWTTSFQDTSLSYVVEGVGHCFCHTTGVEPDPETPGAFGLIQNYPNPFNPTTTIRFRLERGGFVTLTIYDLLGKEIETLISEQRPAGEYAVRWNAEGLSSGVYVCRLAVGGFVETRKLVLQR